MNNSRWKWAQNSEDVEHHCVFLGKKEIPLCPSLTVAPWGAVAHSLGTKAACSSRVSLPHGVGDILPERLVSFICAHRGGSWGGPPPGGGAPEHPLLHHTSSQRRLPPTHPVTGAAVRGLSGTPPHLCPRCGRGPFSSTSPRLPGCAPARPGRCLLPPSCVSMWQPGSAPNMASFLAAFGASGV